VKTLLGAAALAVVVSGGAALPAPAGASGTPLDQARLAAQTSSFSGSIDVEWRDGRVRRRQRLEVKAANGVLLVDGPTPLMAFSRERLVQEDAAWDVLWPAAFGRLSRPDHTAKYDERVSVGPELLGRPTVIIDIRTGRRVRERLHVDAASGLLLRREQFDDRGRVQRSMGFRSLRIEPGSSPLPRPEGEVADGLRLVTAGRLRGAYSAPALAAGYRRTGVFRRDDVVQVVYSDGIYDLSIFEQRGRLASKAVPPGGRPVRIGGAKGWHYTWAGGQVILWHAGRTVYTVVADGPYDDVLHAVRGVKGSAGPSVAHRFRQACRVLVGAFVAD
jgi:hypothetical protein